MLSSFDKALVLATYEFVSYERHSCNVPWFVSLAIARTEVWLPPCANRPPGQRVRRHSWRHCIDGMRRCSAGHVV